MKKLLFFFLLSCLFLPLQGIYAQGSCHGMDEAHVTDTISGDIITLKWTNIEGEYVAIAIFNPETQLYENLGTAKMDDEKFDYKIQWTGEQNFMLTNGCIDLYYKAYVKTGTASIKTTNQGTHAQGPCHGMDEAHVIHTISGDIITLKWTNIEGEYVAIAIFNPETQLYENLGTAKMSDEKFDYKIQWTGEQDFMLTNGCIDLYYKADTRIRTANVETPSYSTGSTNETNIDNLWKCQQFSQIGGAGYYVGYSNEEKNAFVFAYVNGLTTMYDIKKANINGMMTRAAMAKMLSYYAINVLGKKPDHSKKINFLDVTNELDRQYDNGITLAYQLGIMGQGTNKFKPYSVVTRAEFATALSRLLYGMDDGRGKQKYYEPHLAKLYNEGIINNSNPKLQERRGYIMIMLMRSSNWDGCNN